MAGLAQVTATAAWAAEETQRGRVLPSVAVRYLDPATEFVVVRLTDPQYSALLPSGGRTLSARAMLYASDATGKWEALRMDLRTHESRQLTDAEALDPRSLSFQGAERGFWHFDAGRLIEMDLRSGRGNGAETGPGSGKAREVYRTPEGFEKTPGVSYSGDGRSAAFVEKNGEVYRLRLVDLTRGTARTLVEGPEEIREPLLRPKHGSVLYHMEAAAWMVDFSGNRSRRLPLAEGELLDSQWAADGGALLYLCRPPDGRKLVAMREFAPETGSDTWVADTSQFVRFSANADGSVFTGASGSKASPYVLLLARAVKREFTLAEHRASDPRMVAPMFTPNSQSVLFQSDRHGKPAIYSMAVEKFVSETEGS